MSMVLSLQLGSAPSSCYTRCLMNIMNTLLSVLIWAMLNHIHPLVSRATMSESLGSTAFMATELF